MTDNTESNPRAASIRIGSMTAKGYSGQRRHDLRIGRQPKYVDPGRADMNRVLIEPPTATVMRRLAEARRAGRDMKRGIKSNAAVATAGIISFGAEAAAVFEALTLEQQDRAFRLLARAAAMRLRTSLHGLMVHRDEATIHAHFVLCAYDRDGVPLSKSTRPAIMSALQDLTAKVMQRSCPSIERGTRYGDRLAAGADFSDVVHRSVKELHRDLPRDLERRRQEVAKLAEAEAEAAGRVTEMRERVEKLSAKAEMTEKEAKRLATYEKRLSDRIGELEQARAAAEAAKVEADRLADLANQEKIASQAEATRIIAAAEAETKVLREATAADLRRRGAALESLAQEFEAGTITQLPDGRVHARNVEALRAGQPDINPAIIAAAASHRAQGERKAALDAREAALNDREAEVVRRETNTAAIEAQIEQDLREIRKYRAWMAAARDRMAGYLERMAGWLRRPDLPADVQQEARNLVGEGDDIEADILQHDSALARHLRTIRDRPKPDTNRSASEKPTKKPDGPGF